MVTNNEHDPTALNSSLITYYSERAVEFANIYSKQVDHKGIECLEDFLSDILRDRTCIEIACGTGFWTSCIARFANSITAIDINQNVLAMASKNNNHSNVSFIEMDAYNLSVLKSDFNAAFVAFWISHIPKQKLADFFKNLHAVLKPESIVILIDNIKTAERSTISVHKDSFFNAYEKRRLEDGREFLILKNYYSKSDIESVLKFKNKYLMFGEFSSYWCAFYRPI